MRLFHLIIIKCLLFSLPIFSQVTITGHVRNQNRMPVARAEVTTVGKVNLQNFITDDDGYFKLELVKSIKVGSSLRLRVNAEGYHPWNKVKTAAPDMPIEDIFLTKSELVDRSSSSSKPINYSNNDNLNELLDDLYSEDVEIKNAALDQLITKRRQKFNAKQIIKILNGYTNYETHSSFIESDVENRFDKLLISLSELQKFPENDIAYFIERYNNLPPGYQYRPTLLFNFINKSSSNMVDVFCKKLVTNRDLNIYKSGDVKELALNRFLTYENMQPDNFYIDYLDQFKKPENSLYSEFRNVILGLAPYNKTCVLKILNNEELIDSLFKSRDIDYEDNFIFIRSSIKESLEKFISISDLNKTYFYTALCPCYLVPVNWRQPRRLQCDSSHMIR